ncbi:MAG: CBS and ACT domain-containing protein [Deltaproteobacteria bacterium]
MLIKEWMAKDVLTVDENTSLMRATRIMKENNIRRLPVVSHGKLIGIITDRDVKDASPSKTTTLDIHELSYLLSEMKVKDVMTPNPYTLQGSDSLEKAAMIMLNTKISGMPVVDPSGYLIGLLSETDVLRGFIHATGITDGAIQFVFDLPDSPGAVTQVVKELREHRCRVISILTSFEDAVTGRKQVSIRVTTEEEQDIDALIEELNKHVTVIFSARDELKDVPAKRG